MTGGQDVRIIVRLLALKRMDSVVRLLEPFLKVLHVNEALQCTHRNIAIVLHQYTMAISHRIHIHESCIAEKEEGVRWIQQLQQQYHLIGRRAGKPTKIWIIQHVPHGHIKGEHLQLSVSIVTHIPP